MVSLDSHFKSIITKTMTYLWMLYYKMVLLEGEFSQYFWVLIILILKLNNQSYGLDLRLEMKKISPGLKHKSILRTGMLI